MKEAATITLWASALIAIVVAIYTAFLFAQAKGRDFWQSPTLALHMLVHSFMAGAALFSVTNIVFGTSADWSQFISYVLYVAIGLNLFIMLIELTITHPTEDSKRVAHMIVSGRYKNQFWFGSVLIGNVLPLVLVFLGGGLMTAIAGLLIIVGIYITEKIWIEGPQRIQLT
jgi:formate-dependent nitrite reductase membrane component NrfD